MLPAGLDLQAGVNCVEIAGPLYGYGFMAYPFHGIHGASIRPRIVPVERVDTFGDQWPIHALKIARITHIDSHLVAGGLRPALFPLVYSVEHTVDGQAVCVSYQQSVIGQPADTVTDHNVPSFNRCNCGFHALAPSSTRNVELVQELARNPSAVVLDVEMGGTIIQGVNPGTGEVKGWRASRQRILAVFLQPVCRSIVEAAGTKIGGPCGKPARSMSVRKFGAGSSEVHVTSTCEQHQSTIKCWTPGDLADIWGTEVAWWEPPAPPVEAAA